MISLVLDVFRGQAPFIKDYNGYYNARKELDKMQDKIKFLERDSKVMDNYLVLGQKLTVLASYILCFMVTLLVIL